MCCCVSFLTVCHFLPLPLAAPDFLSCRCKASRFVWSFLFLHIPDTLSTSLQGQQLYQHCPLWWGALFSCSGVWDLPTQGTRELRDKRQRQRQKVRNFRRGAIQTSVQVGVVWTNLAQFEGFDWTGCCLVWCWTRRHPAAPELRADKAVCSHFLAKGCVPTATEDEYVVIKT